MSAESPPESVAGLSESGTSNQGLEPLTGGVEGVLQTEQQLNSPTRLTLRLLGVIFAATLNSTIEGLNPGAGVSLLG